MKLKIITFNLGLLIPNKNAYKRIDKFVEQISTKDYDLIFLQEVWPKVLREYLKDRINYKFVLDMDIKPKPIIRIFPKKLHLDSGLLIFSKYEMSNFKRLNYNVNGYAIRFLDGETLVNKSIVGCDIKIVANQNEKSIFVATTHLVSHYVTCSYRFQRRQQINELKEWLSKITNPKIITGDFNISPPSIDGNPLHLETDRDWLECKTAFKNFNKINYHKVKTTYPHRYNLKISKDEGCVDHIFVSEDITILNEKTIYHDKHLDINNNEFYISDHLAIETDLEI